MTPGTQIILSGTLTFGVPLALAVRDLLSTRRAQGGSWDPEPPKPTPPAPSGGGNQITHCTPTALDLTRATPRLPQCLIDAATFQPAAPNPGAPGRRLPERV